MPRNEYLCDCHPQNDELVQSTKQALPDDTTIKHLAKFFSILGDNTRCKLLLALKETPLCVCDLANVLSMTKSSVSHQLRKLKTAGVVKCERNGKQVVYSLDDDHITELFGITLTHIKEKWYEK